MADTEALREALEAKATWFRFSQSTGEYTGEYCSVRPYDDRGMVPMVSIDTAIAALTTERSGEAVAWMYEQKNLTYPRLPNRVKLSEKRWGAGKARHWTETPLYTHPAPKVEELREALERLEQAEANYRRAHDLYGAGSREAGRAWDLMRRAGDEARAILAKAQGA